MAARKKSNRSTKSRPKAGKPAARARSAPTRSTRKPPSSSARKHGAKRKTPSSVRASGKVVVKSKVEKSKVVKGKRKASSIADRASRAAEAARKRAKSEGGRSAAKRRSKSVRSAAERRQPLTMEVRLEEVESQVQPKRARNDRRPEAPEREALTPAVSAKEPLGGGSAAPATAPHGSAGKVQRPIAPEEAAAKPAKGAAQRQGFKLNEFVVYPAHGVGQIVAIEEQEVAGFKLELFVINFWKDKLTLRVPTSKVAGVGMRKISDPDAARRSLEILTGRARIKRTMWSRRAQEYETKINSGDINAIAEVVRDLYRSEAQPEQSYSERQLYEAALDRMVREIAAVQKSNEMDALKTVEAQLQKNQNRNSKPAGAPGSANEIEQAA